MKILYATQATGNGHMIRALELIPLFKKYADVDIFVSGSQCQIKLPFEVDITKYGLSFIPGPAGGISYSKTLKSLRMIQLFQDIRSLKIEDYDLLVNDFEPISSWAAKLKGVKSIGLSHQASFNSEKTPRPRNRNLAQEMIIRHYAPTSDYKGFHYMPYDDKIETPIICRDIRQLNCENRREVCVYLPAYNIDYLTYHFERVLSHKWNIFSPKVKESRSYGNIVINPVSRKEWLSSFARSEALLMGAGFEGPSEAIHHGKKLMVIPMKKQYEQQCNAIALQKLGVNVQGEIGYYFYERLNAWLRNSHVIQYNYPDNSEGIVKEALCRV